MSKAEKNLNEIISLPRHRIVNIDLKADVVEAEIEGQPVERINPEEKDLLDDFDLARQNVRELTEIGKIALKGIVDLARQDDHPRPYEVAGQILKHLSDINKDLLELHEKKKIVKTPVRGRVEEQGTTTNTVFVGSTAELLDAMRKKPNN